MSQNPNTTIAVVGVDIGKKALISAGQSCCVSSGCVVVFTVAMHTPLPKWVIFDRDEASSRSRHVGCAPESGSKSGIGICHDGP